MSARLDTSNGGLCLGARISAYFFNGIINYFEVVGEDKWTNASGFKSESGSYDMTITGSPTQILAPQGLTSGRDITGVNLFENVRKQGALNLDGNSWAEVHDNASVDLTVAITLEAWVYWDSSTGNKGILGRWYGGSGYMLYHGGSLIVLYINNATSIHSYSTDGWVHIVGTYDKVNRKLYVNGSLVDTDAFTDSITNTDNPIDIAKYNGNSAYSYTKSIAQPRIYNRALTAEEVERNYNAGKNTYTN